MTDLLPCPFCGGDAERTDFETVGTALGGDPNAGGSCISCKRCGASSPIHFDRKENLYSSWNDRQPVTKGQHVDETDPPCTDCDDTGVTFQTERRCSCLAGLALKEERQHEWFTCGRLNWECCRVCGIVRRKDGKNSPCRGPVSVGPRGRAESGAGREVAWLIERQFSTDCGQLFETRWYAENDNGWHHWTTVALEAKRFASKAEVEAFPAYQMMAADPTISITEHVFVGVSHVC